MNSYKVISSIELGEETFKFIYSDTVYGYSYTFVHEANEMKEVKCFSSRMRLEDYIEKHHPKLSEYLEWDSRTEVFTYNNPQKESQ